MNTMKKILLLLLVTVALLPAGCRTENEEGLPQETVETENIQIAESDLEESMQAVVTEEEAEQANETLFEMFLNDEIAAYRGSGELFFCRDMCEEYRELCNAEGIEPELAPTFYDLDNDGEDEMIMDWFWGWYGGKYFDVRDGRLYLFAEGDGTAAVLHYIDYAGSTWIYHCDVSHAGRQMFWFERYQGADDLVESFSLYDEYWDGGEHTYSLNEEEISAEEYERLYEEIFQ